MVSRSISACGVHMLCSDRPMARGRRSSDVLSDPVVSEAALGERASEEAEECSERER